MTAPDAPKPGPPERVRNYMGADYVLASAYDKLAEDNARLMAARDQLEVQLAGCGVAAMGWSRGEERAKPGDWGYSASYGDVLKIRDELESLRAQLAAVVDALEGLPGFDAVEQAKKRQAQLNATRKELDLSNRALDVQTRGLGAATKERDTALAQLAAARDRMNECPKCGGMSP